MRRLVFLCLLISSLLASCSLFQAPKLEKVNDFKLIELTADHTYLDLSLVIFNPNGFNIGIKSLQLNIYDKEQNKLSDIRMTQAIEIPKHSTDTLYFEIQVDTRKVAKLVSHSARNVEFNIHAEIVAHVFGITKTIRKDLPYAVNFTSILEGFIDKIPADFTAPTMNVGGKKKTEDNHKIAASNVTTTDTTKPSTLPELFKVEKTNVSDFGFKETELTIKFVLYNPFGLAFTLKDFPAEVTIYDKAAGHGKLAKPLVFDENVQMKEGEIVFTLNNKNSLMSAGKALFKKEAPYQVNGTLMVEGFDTKINKPFHFKGSVVLGNK